MITGEQSRRSQGERGFALLIVLWSMTLLALLTVRLTATGRSELQVAASLRTSAELHAAADGLVYDGVFRLMNGSVADGRNHPAPVQDGRGAIRITSLAGRINPNTASQALMTALLQRVGVQQRTAAALGAAILDWRTPGSRPRPGGAKAAQYAASGYGYAPPGAPFETLEEMGEVLGMTPELMGRLAPHMTVSYPGSPVLADADPVVAAALEEAGNDDRDDEAARAEQAQGVYVRVEAAVTRGAGAVSRRADVWVGQGFQQGSYLVLRWDVPEGE